MQAHATVPTASARRYLGQFIKHFAHKLPFARLETNEAGEVSFPFGRCLLSANDEALRIGLEAAAEPELSQLRDVVERHLVRFAFRETLPIEWVAG